MKAVEFYTQWKRPEKKGFLEVNSGEELVSKEYVPLSKQVEIMTEAGVRLAEYRKAQFHFDENEEVPDDFIDLVNHPDVELPDVQAMAQDLQPNLEGIKKRAAKEASDRFQTKKNEEKVVEKGLKVVEEEKKKDD